MIKFQDDFTTVEESQRLLAAGLPEESADMWYEKDERVRNEQGEWDNDWSKTPALFNYDRDKNNGDRYPYSELKAVTADFTGNDTIPCWSVGRLLEIMHITLAPNHRTMFWLKMSQMKVNNWSGVFVEFFVQFIENGFVDLSKLD